MSESKENVIPDPAPQPSRPDTHGTRARRDGVNLPPPPPRKSLPQSRLDILAASAQHVLTSHYDPNEVHSNLPVTSAETYVVTMMATERHVSWWWSNRYNRLRQPRKVRAEATHMFLCLDAPDLCVGPWTNRLHFHGSVVIPDDQRSLLHACLYAASRFEPRVNCVIKAPSDKPTRVFFDIDPMPTPNHVPIIDALRDGTMLRFMRYLADRVGARVYLAACTTKLNSFHLVSEANAFHDDMTSIGRECAEALKAFMRTGRQVCYVDTSVYAARTLRVLFCRDMKTKTRYSFKHPICFVEPDGAHHDADSVDWTIGDWMHRFDIGVLGTGPIVGGIGH